MSAILESCVDLLELCQYLLIRVVMRVISSPVRVSLHETSRAAVKARGGRCGDHSAEKHRRPSHGPQKACSRLRVWVYGTAVHDLFERMARGERVGRVHLDLESYAAHLRDFLDRYHPEWEWV